MSATKPVPMTHVPVLVALHSSGAGGRQWDAWRRMPPHGATWHTPDLIGYGAAPWPVGAAVSLDTEAQALAALLRTSPQGVHLVGHSYGGSVALQLALRWPRQVRSLTLYEPVRFALLRDGPADDRRLYDGIVAVGRAIGAQLLGGDAQGAAATFVDYWTGEGAWAALPPARRQGIVARMPKVCAEFEALFADTLPLESLRGLALPVRLLAGSRSPAPALRVVERLAQILPAATLRRLEGLGHMGPLEAPQRVAACMAVHDAWTGAAMAA